MPTENAYKSISEEEILSLGTYEIADHRFLKDLNSESYILRHKKTGAKIALLPNADNNKVFYVAFRTPPKDSTGVAHIIEHTVLCGSQDFPVKDPFVEVVKGSLNTFLNAMTYPDKTVYPVASTNEKDFDNLMHVYLDAVFHPNIYSNENIFRQEGWHYETEGEGKDLKITINGVVYNEMKGVMSNPDDVLGDRVLASLYPHTTYSIISGGDPDEIPALTYEAYLDFHRKYYHPSNSYIYLYGDMNMKERLEYLDRAYLSQYEKLDVDSDIAKEPAFAEPVCNEYSYAVCDGEDVKGKTYLSYNFSIPVKEDIEENLAFKILDYVLCDAEGAPVKEALRKKGIGQSAESVYDSGILQPFYSVMAKFADPEDKDEFVKTVDETLQRLYNDGLDRKALLAGINNYEFRYREADFGSYPKGLIYGLDVLDTWLYDEKRPWDNMQLGELFSKFREEAGYGYFKELIKKLLIDNTHKSVIVLKPEPGLTEKNDKMLEDRLASFAASLSKDELKEIKAKEEQLRLWQETPDTREAMDTIPVLSRNDLGRECRKPVNKLIEENGVKILAHPIFTSGIDYVSAVFDISRLPKDAYKYVFILKVLLGAVDTENYGYSELDHEINIRTGGFGSRVDSHIHYNDSDTTKTFEIRFKTMHENLAAALEITKEVILRTGFDDTDRILEVLEEERAALVEDLASSGHVTALTRASSYFSEYYSFSDNNSGIGYHRLLDSVCSMLERAKDGDEKAADQTGAFIEGLRKTCRMIFNKADLLLDYTQTEEAVNEALPVIKDFADSLFEEECLTGECDDKSCCPDMELLNEAFITAGQVQYVCRAGNFRNKGLDYTGALKVLRVIMGYDYLWTNVRVKGGAYGCMSSFGKNGDSYFVTYRDPHIKMSVETFENAADYIRNFDPDEKTLDKYVIGTISNLDRPLTPGAQGRYGLSVYLLGEDVSELQKERDEVINCTAEDIRKLADHIEAIIDTNAFCVVGGAQKIGQYKDMFEHIGPLIAK